MGKVPLESTHHNPITATNVVAAVVYGDRYQQRRIRAWGEHYHRELRLMGAEVKVKFRKVSRRQRRQRADASREDYHLE